jgi:LysR family transcriptional regulator, hydrogen peroxide-inducible genes activator
MTLQQLEYVLALDEHRNFVRAAEACFVTQPTLSMQIKKLEEEWNVLLFQRGNGPLVPTKMGEQVILRARRIHAEIKALRDTMLSEQESLQGTLRIGVIPTVAAYVLPLFLQAFALDHPGLSLLVRELQSEKIIEGLHHDTLDVGLLALPVEDAELEEMPLYREPFWLCVSEDLPAIQLDAKGLRKLGGPLVLTGGNCLRNQVLQFCGSDLPSKSEVIYDGGSLEALMRFVGQGDGYTLVPELAIPDHLPKGTVMRAFPEPAPEREIGLVVHGRFVRRKLIEHLGQSIRANVPKSLLMREGRRLTWR